MEIGVIIYFNSMDGIEAKLAELQKNNFKTCQLNCWQPDIWTAENAAIMNDLLKKYDVTPSAFWCGWTGPCVWNLYEGQTTIGLVPEDQREHRVAELKKGADFAKMMGITDVVTHMGFIPENPNDPNFQPFCDAVREVAEHLQKNDQYLLFETGQETPTTMLRCFEVVGTDNLGVNLDTANLILYGRGNPVDALDVFGKYVRNIHAKDGKFPTNGHDLGVETRLGEGRANFRELFTKLYELGYNTHVTIEREISGEQQLIDILASRTYLQNLIDEIYA